MTDFDDQPGDDAPDLRKPEPPTGAPAKSIWEPLDGSEPRHEPPAATFSKPAAAPLQFPGVAPQAPTGQAPPAQVDGRAVYVLAGWGSRFGAWLLDNLIFGLSVLVISVPLGTAQGLTFEDSLTFLTSATLPDGVDSSAGLWALLAAQLVAMAALPAIFLVRWNGETPGKRLARVRVVTADGAPLTFRVAIIREVLWKGVFVSGLLSFTFGLGLLLNYLWPLWDQENRAGEDFVAKTRVVAVPANAP